MDFLDDEAGVSSDSDVLVPSSQADGNPRSRKRRRVDTRQQVDSDEDTYDLPDSGEGERDGSQRGSTEAHKSKYEDHIHVPQFGDRASNTFVTQLTQQYSSPSRIRGPRWMKPRDESPPSPSRRQAIVAEISSKQPTVFNNPSTVDEFDVEDDLALLEAFENAAAVSHGVGKTGSVSGPVSSHMSVPASRAALQKSNSFRQTTLHGKHTTQQALLPTQSQSRTHNWPLANRNEPTTHHKINRQAMSTWVYPTNLGRIRDYQYNIVHKGLYNNLLVALPTGLGKTFIAATVMLNWFRWTEGAQIIFVAPTKPLVSQQVDACFNIAGIPRSQTTMLTGEIPPGIRAEEWQEKRVFFLTPQTLINDLKSGMCDPKKIVLVVVDEAHKATGNYAYVEVVKFMRRFNSSFRVLALTATPGSTVESVQAVIDGLGIARVEIRTEESLDIRDFVHSRNVEFQIFDNSDEITMSLELFCAATGPLLSKLCSQNAYWAKNPEQMTLFGLKTAWEKWAKSEPGRNSGFPLKAMIRAIFLVLMSLAHNLELLKYHGIGPFYHKMKIFADEAHNGGKYAKQIAEDANFKKMVNRLRGWINNPDFIGHPKLSYLKTVVLNHFLDADRGQDNAAESSNTRIMIFAHYRDSAEEIVRVLKRHGPIIKPHVFVGQSGTKGSEGMDQKTQLDVIKKFKAGTYNTIVATSIGEEGLDIGEVDLIVCYDCSKSPIRMLQRMGRTGRKRAGNIVLLLMRGKEETDYMKAKDNYQKMQSKIEDGREFHFHDDLSHRIVPKDILPTVDKREVVIPIENTQGGTIEPRRRRTKSVKRPPKKFHMPDGVETGFGFVGTRRKSQVKSKQSKTTVQSEMDTDVAATPPLKEVILTEAEEEQLESRYVRVAGLQDQYIQQVRFEAFPEQQRILGGTASIKHSLKTGHLVKAYSAMRNPKQDWDRPWQCEEFESVTQDGADQDQARYKVKSRVSPSTLSTETIRSPAQYYDEEEGSDCVEFRQPGLLTTLGNARNKHAPGVNDMFAASQVSLGEDMPELESILGRKSRASTGATRMRNRRIVDSDDDE